MFVKIMKLLTKIFIVTLGLSGLSILSGLVGSAMLGEYESFFGFIFYGIIASAISLLGLIAIWGVELLKK